MGGKGREGSREGCQQGNIAALNRKPRTRLRSTTGSTSLHCHPHLSPPSHCHPHLSPPSHMRSHMSLIYLHKALEVKQSGTPHRLPYYLPPLSPHPLLCGCPHITLTCTRRLGSGMRAAGVKSEPLMMSPLHSTGSRCRFDQTDNTNVGNCDNLKNVKAITAEQHPQPVPPQTYVQCERQ